MSDAAAHPADGAVRRARGPAIAAGAAVGGAVLGAVAREQLRSRRRPRLLGLPLPSRREVRGAARHLAHAGQRFAELQADVREVREQAHERTRQSPIEVLLAGLTSRRLPRRD